VLVVVLANQAMRMETADIALMKRLRPIEFTQPSNLDMSLKFKLRKEMPGILRWLVEGAERGVKRGNNELEPTPSMVALRENMATSVDDCLRFLEEALEEKWVKEVTPNGVFKEFVPVGDLYSRYVMWCAGEGISFPCGKKSFATRIGRRFPQIRSNGVRFRGLIK
jgi:phage/plasmid-associated DNA primase